MTTNATLHLPASYASEVICETEWGILTALNTNYSQNGYGLTQADLREDTGKSRARVSEALTRLVEHGLVEDCSRKTEPANRYVLATPRIFS